MPSDGTFWMGIGIGAILAFAAAVAANLCHNKIIRILDRGRIVSHNRFKKRADRFYKINSDLNSGRRDRYLFMLALSQTAIIAMIAFSTMMVCAFILLGPKLSGLGLFELLPRSQEAAYIYSFMFLAFAFLLSAVRLIIFPEKRSGK